MTDLTEHWVNIYKSEKYESYWTGTFCYKTKEEAVKDLVDNENYLTTVNIKDMLNLQTQNAQLKEEVENCEFILKSRESEIVKLKEQINHLLKTQARQFVDNQKLQVKAEKAKDVVNIDTARQIKQLKELLRECKERLIYCTISTHDVQTKIDEALK